MAFWAGVGVGSLVTSGLWWIYVRHFSGVTSDLKDVASDVKNAADKIKAAT